MTSEIILEEVKNILDLFQKRFISAMTATLKLRELGLPDNQIASFLHGVM